MFWELCGVLGAVGKETVPKRRSGGDLDALAFYLRYPSLTFEKISAKINGTFGKQEPFLLCVLVLGCIGSVFRIWKREEFMKPTPFVYADPRKCTACGACVRDCLAQILTLGADGVPRFVQDGESRCFQCQHCMAVCPSGAFSFGGKDPDDSLKYGPIPEPGHFLNLLRQRRSIRAYRRENAASEVLETLRRAMDFVPTGCNDHRLHFTWADKFAVTDTFRRDTAQWLLERIDSGTLPDSIARFAVLKERLANGEDIFFRNAPHFAAVSVPPDAKDAHIDPYIAAAQLELLANSFGLGTCWAGMATDLFRESAELLARLGIPEGWELRIVLLFGIPDVLYARTPQPEPCPHRILGLEEISAE